MASPRCLWLPLPGVKAMSDDLTEHRNRRTLQGVVCARTPDGTLHQDDIDEIARFKGYLTATAHLPKGRKATPEQAAERRRIYREHYPEDET